jgi:hypothetical protein
VLDQLRAWQIGSQGEQPHGPNAYENSVFYQWYWVSWTPPVVGADLGDNHVVPSVDNAWLAASLITIREYAEANGHPALTRKAGEILADMDFTLWYHADTHLFSWGAVEEPQDGTLADYYSNENRIINFVARAMGQLNMDEYLLSLGALQQSPGTYGSISVGNVAWDGSFFTYAAPALFVRETGSSYGEDTIQPAVRAQIAYAQDEGYDAWGLSDCFDAGDGGYVQQGAPPAAMPVSPETRPGLVAPHASALVLITPLFTEAITNLQTVSDTFPCAHNRPYGFRDSVMTNPLASNYGQCSERYSVLAKEWTFLSIVNRETGFIWKYFYRDGGVRTAHQEMFGEYQLHLPLIAKKKGW